MKTLVKLTLKELERTLPTMSKNEQITCTGGNNVVVNVTRFATSSNSTLSYFNCLSYDDCGNCIGSFSGYFLEPAYNSYFETVSGSDYAISAGSYLVVPSTYRGSESYEISNILGRFGVKIHSGNTGEDTTGCLLPGSDADAWEGDYSVSNSIASKNQLFETFRQNGGCGITINISNGF
jgi:hypothetical protein